MERPQLRKIPLWVLSLTLCAAALLYGLTSRGGAVLQKRSIAVQTRGDLDWNDLSRHSANTSLTRRDDYSCSASAPCSNGACCGASGYCGYGPKYCGGGCLSQCDATAECGKFASEPDKKCPLNVCCSQFGFCGTTEDFCDDKCQSNCEQHPTPPGGGTGKVFEKVIGYYESWSDRKLCHKVKPTDLPLDALTHVNYAFAYIDPDSYEVVTMDTSTPGSLFDDTTILKQIKPDLEVWVSIGGWTFSDDNTATQPVFGDIAESSSKRQQFANNLVHFMSQHGFDGVDLDWEYPGTPDRGGRERDTDNYVSLLKTLRETFDKSGGKYGITFTAPSSFWYLRWFNLPGMMKYADWMNFMTYDLHGTWDASNPIGSIVQGHTNLTEIKLATELLWRNDIAPEKVVLGFGFYGRSFTLADSSCSKPGCPFSGASNPGPCTATGGYLGFYEIREVLKSGAKPIHDEDAAVNYLVFDSDQWISYDDDVTFKQKVDWANKVGLGGSLIWASDLDDDKYSAHSALLGKKVESTSSLQSVPDLVRRSQALSLTESVKGRTGEQCFKYKGKCKNLNDNEALADACGPGNTVVGWDDAGCGKKNHHYGKPICCPTDGAPTSCRWRGDHTGGLGGDCSGQCHEGEINVAGIRSSWGGGFTNDGNTDKCRRGYKSFCCVAPDLKALTKDCSLTSCGGKCPSKKHAMFQYYDDCWFGNYKTYCCPDPAPISKCHWVGDGGDCTNAHCDTDELEVARDPYGDPRTERWACGWGRDKAACCKIGQIQLETKPATCSTDICDAIPGFCDSNEDDSTNFSRRSETESPEEALYKRGNKKSYRTGMGGPKNLIVTSVRYPGPSQLYNNLALKAIPFAFRITKEYCIGPAIKAIKVPLENPERIGLNGLDTELILDRGTIAGSFVVSMFTGFLPTGKRAQLVPIGQSFFDRWNIMNPLLKKMPRIGSNNGPRPGTINARLMTCLGAFGFRQPFSLLEKGTNIAKGKLMKGDNMVGLTNIETLTIKLIQEDTHEAADRLLSTIRTGFAVFEYLKNPHVTAAWAAVNEQMRTQFLNIEQVTGLDNLVDWWDAWLADFSIYISLRGQRWAYDALGVSLSVLQQNNQ
ncbi:glycoside hydrolase family 18 protein, partial [Hortaea werneckii]